MYRPVVTRRQIALVINCFCVGFFVKNYDFGTILDAPEYHFRGISGRIGAMECNVIIFKCHWGRLIICLGKLVKNGTGFHAGVQSYDSRNVADLEAVVNASIECNEACAFDVN